MKSLELLTALCDKLGLKPDLSAGAMQLLFDNDAVNFEVNDGSLYVMAEIAPVAGKEALFRKLLEANYLGAVTGGGAIGINAKRQMLALHRIFYGDTDYAFFEAQLNLLVLALRQIKEAIATPQ